MGAMLCGMQAGTQESKAVRSHLLRVRLGMVTAMANVIEYDVLEEFGKRSGKWTQSEQCGKIIPFPATGKKSAREPAGLLALRESNGAELQKLLGLRL